MKKISKILIVFGVLAAVFLTTSCGAVNQTYDTWYKYENTINELPIANAGDYEDSTGAKKQGNGMLKDADLYVRYNDVDGLTLRVITRTKQEITFAGGAYTIPDVTVVAGGEKTYSTNEFNPLKWNALIRLGSFSQKDPPSDYTDISQMLKGQFNLKRIIAEILLSWLQ